MSIYIARSPYRSAMQSRRRVKISFPKLGAFFARKPGAERRAARRTSVVSPVSEVTMRTRQAMSTAEGRRVKTGARGGSLNIGGALKKVKEATMRFEFGPATAVTGLFIISLLLGSLYLAHFNKVATKGYDLRRLEADRQQLLNQYDIKNMKLAGVKSLANIAASDRVSAMRHPAEIVYVRGNTALASR